MTRKDVKINSNIEQIFKESKTIAIIGLSNSPTKDSYRVGSYLQKKGFTLYPVNPKYKSILDIKCYPDIQSIPDQIDIVDIFRNPEYVLPIVKEAVEIGVKTIWMQLGVINNEAADYALDAGVNVVMNRCIKVEHRRIYPDILPDLNL
jgi:predicted CoA-binding protein